MTRESDIEKYLVTRAKANGGIAYKFKSPGRRNVPDRILMTNGMELAVKAIKHIARDDANIAYEEFVRDLLFCFISFVEVKAPGEPPREGQIREHNRLREMGFYVEVIDSKDDVDFILECGK